MSDSESKEPVRGAHCAGCGELHAADGKNAGVSCGRFLCKDCSDNSVTFVAECLDCDWDYEYEDTEFNKYHARQRVQQEGNSHETRKSFDDESHETVWREIADE